MLENCSDGAFDISVNCRCSFVLVHREPHALGDHGHVEETRLWNPGSECIFFILQYLEILKNVLQIGKKKKKILSKTPTRLPHSNECRGNNNGALS